jgi:hypothetical protein
MKLRIQGIGPHLDRSIEFDPTATTTVSGPSTSGKSTLMHAIAFALWGQDATGAKFDAGMVSGAGAASFDGAGRKGTSRAIVVDGTPTPGGTEEQFRASLPAHYRDPETAGLVMFPMRWTSLLEGAGGGLALRAALDRMLPGPTAADLLADLPKTAPRDEKAAAALVTSYRRDANTARGRAQGLRAAVPTTPPPAGPTDEQIQAARAELDASAAAVEDLAAWRLEDAEHRAGHAAIAGWQRRRDAIAAPAFERALVTEDLELAAEAERAANDTTARAVEAARAAGNARAAALRAAEQWDARAEGMAEPDAPAPTAEQITDAEGEVEFYGAKRAHVIPEPSKPRGYRPPVVEACPGVAGCLATQRAEADADRVADEVAASWAAYDERIAAVPANPVVARHLIRLAEAWRAWNLLGPRPEIPTEPAPVAAIYASAAQEALDAARTSAAAWAAHDARVEALGPRPAEPAPLRPRPDAPDVTAARETIASAERAAIRLADHLAAVAKAEAAATAAETDATQADQLLATAESWLVAVRSAPARALAGKLALLGPGALQVLDHEGKTRVEINGRPWYLASHGERVAADAGFRLRLRAAAGLGALLVFIDDVTSVGGLEIPTAPGVVLLVTTAAGELEVATA